MSSRFGVATAMLAATLFGCDPNVVVGYAPPRASPRDAGSSGKDASAAPADSGSLPADASAGPPDAGAVHDASPAHDAGLPRVTWPSGVHAGNEVQLYLDFGTWRGRPNDLAHVFVDRTSWDNIVNPGWPVDMFSSFSGKLLMSEPLYPEGQGNNKDCAAGMYDSDWKRLGTFLVAHNRGDSIIRLGWGPNDTTHPWRADADPGVWISCFRRVVSAIRSTDPKVSIDWSFNPLGPPFVASGNPYDAYPGDAYVDFIGIEAYDMYPSARTESEWTAKCNDTTGLCRVIDFARAHGKKLGIAEWGVVSCGGDPGGDNPFFVEKMLETFAANADVMGYEAYFEDDGTDVCSAIGSGSQNPNASAKYMQIYGRR